MAVVLLRVIATAQVVPLGSEFLVNTYTTDDQVFPVVGPAGSGFVIVWDSDDGQDGSFGGIFGQLYDSAGAPLGTEFQLNTYTTGAQQLARIAPQSAGGFVVVWEDNAQDGSGEGVFGQRFTSAGTLLGTEFQVNTATTYFDQARPDVAAQGNGGFVVVWMDNQDVIAKRFDSLGQPDGTEFMVNTYTTSFQGEPVAATTNGGGFVVVWESDDQDGNLRGIFGQRFDSLGAPQGTEFQVNSYTTGNQAAPAVDADANGFVVVWDSFQDGNGTGVFARRYDSNGLPSGSEFQVNTYTTTAQYDAAVAIGPSGDFAVVWTSNPGQDGHQHGVFGQGFDSLGDPVGSEFQVNTYTTSSQSFLSGPKISYDLAGNLIVVWEGPNLIDLDAGVYGQRFAQTPAPTATMPPTTPTPSPSPTPVSPGSNHYLCRQVKDLKVPAKFAGVTGITIVDQTGADSCDAKKPFLLCDPVNKNGGGIPNPALHYCCYKLKCSLKPAVNYEVTDQFWSGTISTKKPKFLCNPCQKAPA